MCELFVTTMHERVNLKTCDDPFLFIKTIFLQDSACVTMKVTLPLSFIMSFISCSQVYEHSVCLRSLMIIYAYLKSQLKYLELH